VGDVRILVTASGAPGSAALLRGLRENGQREVTLVGTDLRPQSAGRFLCNEFHQVPAGNDPGFAAALAEIASRERVDVVFPQSSAEILAISRGVDLFDVPVLVCKTESIERANSKGETARIAAELGVPQPRSIEVLDADAFRSAARELGYPGRDVCMKPVEGKGGRGFRVLSATADRRQNLLEGRPGTLLPLSLEEASEILESGDGFPAMLVMELIVAPEFATDAICRDGRTLVISAKTREAMRAGLAMEFEIVDRPDLLHSSRMMIEALDLDHVVNLGFIGEYLLEVNARISTIVYQPELNMPWLAVKLALGEITEQELIDEYAPRVEIGRRVTRYYDQLEYLDHLRD
jgi:biotin carboxylase